MTSPVWPPGQLDLMQRMGIIQNQEWRATQERANLLMKQSFTRMGANPNDPFSWATGNPVNDSLFQSVSNNSTADPVTAPVDVTTPASATDAASADNQADNSMLGKILNPDEVAANPPANPNYTDPASTPTGFDYASLISNMGSFAVRGIVIVLGFIFVAVGLMMFGRGTVVQVTKDVLTGKA